jgi:uncharacterized protein (UPF0305 family)
MLTHINTASSPCQLRESLKYLSKDRNVFKLKKIKDAIINKCKYLKERFKEEEIEDLLEFIE